MELTLPELAYEEVLMQSWEFLSASELCTSLTASFSTILGDIQLLFEKLS